MPHPCDACSCSVVPDSKPVVPSFAFRTGLLVIVTDAPSGAEALGRTPFVGGAGEILEATLRAIAIHAGKPIESMSDSVLILHAISRPTPGNKPPKIADVRSCRDRLLAELDEARPHAVLSVGASACASLSGTGKPTPITKWRGQMRWLELPSGVKVPWVATISGGSVAARADLYRDFSYDIWKVWTQKAPLPQPVVNIIDEANGAE